MTVELLDPTGEREPVVRRLSARLPTLAGSTIAFLDISKPRGDVFLDRLEELFNERGAKVVRYRKPTYTKPAPLGLRQEIVVNGDAAVVALAD
jgi:hypothetical protein